MKKGQNAENNCVENRYRCAGPENRYYGDVTTNIFITKVASRDIKMTDWGRYVVTSRK